MGMIEAISAAAPDQRMHPFPADIKASAIIEPEDYGIRCGVVVAFSVDTPSGPYLVDRYHPLWPLLARELEDGGHRHDAEADIGWSVQT